MGERAPRGAGCLIGIDGADSNEVASLADGLQEALTERKIPVLVSRWDASALFTDFAAAPAQQRDISTRTLMLLYAADLAFRCRWEIAPALEDGQVVLATPYVTTCQTFGAVLGVSQEWLATLLRFAPVADRTIVLREPKGRPAWKRRPERGFCDCCTALLEASPQGFARRKTRSAMATALATASEKHGGLHRKRDRADLVDEIVKLRYRRAGPPRTRRHAR